MNADKWATMEVIAERNKHANTTFGALAAAYLELLAEQTTLRERLAEVDAKYRTLVETYTAVDASYRKEPSAAKLERLINDGNTIHHLKPPFRNDVISSTAAPYEDGHYTVCGLKWPDERETLEPHECPPGRVQIQLQADLEAERKAREKADKFAAEEVIRATDAESRLAAEIAKREAAERDRDATARTNGNLLTELAEARELETMRAAAISTAALMNTRQSGPPLPKDHPYWTIAYQDVVDAVGREMRERERAESAERGLRELCVAIGTTTDEWAFSNLRVSNAAAVAMEQAAKICESRDYENSPEQTAGEAYANAIRSLIPDAGRVEGILRDAERYRWLRSNSRKTAEARGGCPEHPALVFYYGITVPQHLQDYTADGLDAAIDAARAQKGEKA